MADLVRLRRRRPIQGLTAAAKILQATIHDDPHAESWAEEAWRFRRTIGEVRYAEMWLGNSMGRARLFAARRESPSSEPEPLPDGHPANELVARLAGGVGGQSALLRAFATYLMTPGIGCLVGASPDKTWAGATWQVRDTEEVRLASTVRTSSGRMTYEVQNGPDTQDWVNLGEGGLVVKVWRPDPQRHWRPDSPVRGALGILNELSLLSQAIESMATSRLKGAGLLPLPQGVDYPGGFEKFVKELLKHFTQPIRDRASASAAAPFPFEVPKDVLGKIGIVDFFSAFDEHALKLREELIWRLGIALDMPVRGLTGEQENHWGKAATAEEGVKIHVQPNLEVVCDGLTEGYLRPAMLGEARLRQQLDLPQEVGMLTQATQGQDMVDPQTGQQIIVWYDISDLTAKPDRSQDAQAAYDKILITGDGLRQETGLSEWDAPEGEEYDRRIWLKVLDSNPDPDMQRKALEGLGILKPGEMPPAEPAAPPGGAPPPAPAEPAAPPADGPVPATKPSDPAPSKEDRPLPEAADIDLAVVAAADAIVYRALEKAGNRLRQAMARQSRGRKLAPEVDLAAHVVHTACVAAQLQPVGQLLTGAWERVPEVAARLGVDPDALTASLDRYVYGLITSRREHSWDLLAGYLAADPPTTPAARVLRLVGAEA